MVDYRPIVTERHLPSALTDRQTQDMVDRAKLEERERIVQILRTHEPPRFPTASWSWEQWRKNLINAIAT